jgi:tetratricopeptide (TPR) repeat protein
MWHMLRGILVLVLALSMAAGKSERQVKPATPAERYRALLKEYQDALEAFSKASAAAKTDEERAKLIRPWDQFVPRFMTLAEEYPRDPVAVDALVWVVDNTSDGTDGKDDGRAKAIAILLRDHTQSGKLGPVCPRLAAGYAKESETFLRTLLEKNPHKDVQGLACLALAQFLNKRLRLLDKMKDAPEIAKEYESRLGKVYVDQLQRQDRAKLVKEVETLFEQAAEKYGDAKGPLAVAAKAKTELFKLRFLAVGKVAPEIEGEDQNGTKFKLSDYRGKVVLLDFWRET